MARGKSVESIEKEIREVEEELSIARKTYESLQTKRAELEKQKQEKMTQEVMRAFKKSGKSYDELMTFLSI